MYPFIILCGGLATRLGSIALNSPKCLLEVNNKPFLYYQLSLLEKIGPLDVYLSVGHLSDKFDNFLNDFKFKNLNIKLINDGPVALGTGGAVKNILKKIDTPAFVMYGDSFLRVNFVEVFNAYDNNNSEGPLLVIYKNNGKFDTSNVFCDGNTITYSKTTPNSLADHIDYGVSIYKYSDFDETGKSFDLSVVQERFSRQKKLQHFIADKRFIEIGTPESYREAEKYFSKHEN
jgi:NDP-sugar pyrophosphorylase family protein